MCQLSQLKVRLESILESTRIRLEQTAAKQPILGTLFCGKGLYNNVSLVALWSLKLLTVPVYIRIILAIEKNVK